MAQHADPPELLPRTPSSRRSANEEPIEVRRYIDAIRRARWLIFGITVILTGVVVGVSLSVPNRYEAEASIVKQIDSGPFESQDVAVVTRELNTIGQLLTTSNVLDAAARQLPGETGDTLAEKVKSSVDPEANLIFVTASGGAAGRAAPNAPTPAPPPLGDERAGAERTEPGPARANLLEEQSRLRN